MLKFKGNKVDGNTGIFAKYNGLSGRAMTRTYRKDWWIGQSLRCHRKWPQTRIDKLPHEFTLGNSHSSSSKWYHISEIEKLEKTKEFKKAKALLLARSAKLEATAEKKANDLFEEVMRQPIVIPKINLDKLREKHRKNEDNEFYYTDGDSEDLIREDLRYAIAEKAGIETRRQKIRLRGRWGKKSIARLEQAYKEKVIEKYPELKEGYVPPPKPFDPFDL